MRYYMRIFARRNRGTWGRRKQTTPQLLKPHITCEKKNNVEVCDESVQSHPPLCNRAYLMGYNLSGYKIPLLRLLDVIWLRKYICWQDSSHGAPIYRCYNYCIRLDIWLGIVGSCRSNGVLTCCVLMRNACWYCCSYFALCFIRIVIIMQYLCEVMDCLMEQTIF